MSDSATRPERAASTQADFVSVERPPERDATESALGAGVETRCPAGTAPTGAEARPEWSVASERGATTGKRLETSGERSEP
ncbi:hypothetical protein AArc1_4045 (plasmid) [Natrarchaeobaculum sulfurireducens]|uniref:Uncharacterized protein n=1 Tax=Natrarchaeobaculum sulfurireducens TaxID=2044521 RepID=A0A346P9G7_9EURY|nr:hypothetical protein AArc1_4045 [Natrarchaeobaculum sulfurireducens]